MAIKDTLNELQPKQNCKKYEKILQIALKQNQEEFQNLCKQVQEKFKLDKENNITESSKSNCESSHSTYRKAINID